MVKYMNQTKSIKKEKSPKSKRPQKEFMGSVLKIYTEKGWEYMLYLQPKSNGLRISRRPLHSQECRRIDVILSRRECARLLLSLQHQFGREPIRIRNKTGRRKSKGTLS